MRGPSISPAQSQATQTPARDIVLQTEQSADTIHPPTQPVRVQPFPTTTQTELPPSQPVAEITDNRLTPDTESNIPQVISRDVPYDSVEIVIESSETTERKLPRDLSRPTTTSQRSTHTDATTPLTDNYMKVLTQEIHRLTNVERARAAIPSLAHDDRLATIATGHSADMAHRGYFAHTSPDGCTIACRIQSAEYHATAWGENTAWRSSTQRPEPADLAAHFVDDWMNSAGHRTNILSNTFTYQGVGAAYIGNKIYATVNFAKPR